MEKRFYAISEKWETLAEFTSTEQVDNYLKEHPETFQVIYRKKISENNYGPVRVYYTHLA